VIYSKNPLEFISVLQMFSIPIILSDRAMIGLLNKYTNNLTYVRSLIAKLVEIFGKPRLLNLKKLNASIRNIAWATNWFGPKDSKI